MDSAKYSPVAREDIDAIVAEISDDNSDAAWKFLDRVEDTVRQLVDFPTLGAAFTHPDHPDLRAKLVKAFRNYIIFYAPLPDGVYIVRVLHGARDIPQELDR